MQVPIQLAAKLWVKASVGCDSCTCMLPGSAANWRNSWESEEQE